jgi:RHS repeat-associated protein
MTSDGTTAHTWNARNQLSAYGSTSFAYDAFGRRIQNASGKAFLYDGLTAVQELSGSTVTANLLIGFGADEIFTRTDSAGVRNFLTDSLGSSVALTDSSGTVQTQYSYEPFGKTTASGASNANTFQFIGRENDGAALYYYRARYYNPTFQRFISEDPLDFGGGDVDLYGYVSDDPTDLIDPDGEAGSIALNGDTLVGPPGAMPAPPGPTMYAPPPSGLYQLIVYR